MQCKVARMQLHVCITVEELSIISRSIVYGSVHVPSLCLLSQSGQDPSQIMEKYSPLEGRKFFSVYEPEMSKVT